jgi:hypothetical protein
MSVALVQWSRRCRRLLIGQHAAEAVTVAVIPALGPVPPLLVRTKLAFYREH